MNPQDLAKIVEMSISSYIQGFKDAISCLQAVDLDPDALAEKFAAKFVALKKEKEGQ